MLLRVTMSCCIFSLDSFYGCQVHSLPGTSEIACRERRELENDLTKEMTWEWVETLRWTRRASAREVRLGPSGQRRESVKLHQDVAAVLQLKEADGCCGRFVGRFNPQSLLIFNANWPRNWSMPALRPLDIGDNPGVESVEKPPRGYSRQVKAHSCSHHQHLLFF